MISRFSKKLQHALDTGVPVVTPNNRMARTLIQAHDGARHVAGARVWPTAQVLPYAAFVDLLWQQLSLVMLLPRRLNGQACRIWWLELIERDDENAALYATAGAARLAQEAWCLMQVWRETGDGLPWRQWQREGPGVSYDAARFARWAARYHEKLRHGDFIDEASVPDFIAAQASRLSGSMAKSWVMAGFVEHTPQALRLMVALREAGMPVDDIPALDAVPGSLFQYRAANAQEELRDALRWAWGKIQKHICSPNGQVAIVMPALATQARAVRWQVEDSLPEPDLCNVSLGEPLSEKPLVHAVLEWLSLIDQPLPVGRVAALLRSPYFPSDIHQRARRAACERRWIEDGQRDIFWQDVLKALSFADQELRTRWHNAASQLPTQATPGDWPRYLLQGWQALGWPGSQTLDSVDYQIRDAWMSCIEKLPLLEAVAPRLSRRSLLQTLRQWATETLFQPEGSKAPIQILGTLEAAGLPFEAVWVAGLDSHSWPPAAESQALLPLAWQRAQRMPRASSEQTFSYAGQMQVQWRHMAPEVVLSYPAENEGQACTPAALLISQTPYAAALPLLPGRMVRANAVAMESFHDSQAPVVARDDGRGGDCVSETIRHGSSVLAQQSDCPFKAFAFSRLRVRTWPIAAEGLSPIERGNLLHAVLRQLWRHLESQAALLTLSETELNAAIDTAYQQAVADGNAVKPLRWQVLPTAIAMIERTHVAALLRAWCAIEKTRASFRVVHTEIPLTLELAGMTYKLQADRVDTLDDGGVALIDYKTGKVVSLRSWFEARPQAPQLGVYALAWQAMSTTSPEAVEPVRALVYAHVREDGMEIRGMTESPDIWPRLDAVAAFGFDTIGGAQHRWQVIFTALTQDFLAGDARVLPRDKQVCTICGLQSLCRIGALQDDASESDHE